MVQVSAVDHGIIGLSGEQTKTLRDPPAKCGRWLSCVPWLMLLAFVVAGCKPEAVVPPEIRPVRIVKAERRVHADHVALTGDIEARDEVSLGFRFGGRMIERLANVGDQVAAGRLIARLDLSTRSSTEVTHVNVLRNFGKREPAAPGT
jgi:multidrug efflux pump subunit AcrA (membrane-fusion protein)